MFRSRNFNWIVGAFVVSGLGGLGVSYLTKQRSFRAAFRRPAAAAQMPSHRCGELKFEDIQKIGSLLKASASDPEPARRERDYFRSAQAYLLENLVRLYQADGKAGVQMSYPDFAPESAPNGGLDGGFGLHVVKKLELQDRVILVNELWPFLQGKVQLPNEIRARVFPKDHPELAIVQRYRPAWTDVTDVTRVFEHTEFEPGKSGGADRRVHRRVSASVFECKGCHGSHPQSNSLTPEREFVDIKNPDLAALRANPGYKNFLDYLDRTYLKSFAAGTSEAAAKKRYLDEMKKGLETPAETMTIPNLLDQLISKYAQACATINGEPVVGGGIESLPEDLPYVNDSAHFSNGWGIYSVAGTPEPYLDSLLEIEMQAGRFSWWSDNQKTTPAAAFFYNFNLSALTDPSQR